MAGAKQFCVKILSLGASFAAIYLPFPGNEVIHAFSMAPTADSLPQSPE